MRPVICQDRERQARFAKRALEHRPHTLPVGGIERLEAQHLRLT
jgi:hypothetical protein